MFKPKHQNYRVCRNLAGETLYELHKTCTCEECKRKVRNKAGCPNQATAYTKEGIPF